MPTNVRNLRPPARFAFLHNRRLWITIAVIAGLIALRMTGIGECLSLDTLQAHRKTLAAWVGSHQLLAAAVYALIYIGAVALSLPGAVYLTLASGLLFGAVLGTALTVVSATIGATIVFLFAKRLVGDRIIDHLGAQYPNLVKGIRDNAWSYLLVLRFLPLFPFFLVNLIAALAGVRLSTYLFTTFAGILPGSAVYVLSGVGLGSVLDDGAMISAGSVLTPPVLASLIGLAALSLVAVPIRKKFNAAKATVQTSYHD